MIYNITFLYYIYIYIYIYLTNYSYYIVTFKYIIRYLLVGDLNEIIKYYDLLQIYT